MILLEGRTRAGAASVVKLSLDKVPLPTVCRAPVVNCIWAAAIDLVKAFVLQVFFDICIRICFSGSLPQEPRAVPPAGGGTEEEATSRCLLI